jgi:hypothetical protein
MPMKSKKDEVVAKALYATKENMKKIKHPLAGLFMGDEGASFALQLNATNTHPNNSTLLIEQKDKAHNDTVKGAIVKFAKSSKLNEPEPAKKADTKTEAPKETKPAEVKKAEAPKQEDKKNEAPKGNENKKDDK